MRHVTARLEVPEPAELLRNIRAPERFRPQPRIRSLPELRRDEAGVSEIRLTPDDRWRRVHPMIVALHDALRADATPAVEPLVDLVLPLLPKPDRRVAEHVVRGFFLALRSAGHVDIPFEEPPPVFAGRYERVKELGRGGMGIAHLCRDLETGRLVVVKHAWGWSKPIERAEATNRKEAAILRELDHPRIPPLLDAFEVDGILHMVRLFAPGTHLTKTTPRPWDLDAGARASIVRGMAEAIAHVHERGFLYLDLKPANVVMASIEAGPFVLDFGICQPMQGEVTRLRGVLGSRGYCAPELRKLTASPRSDVFSLGRTWYHLASGHKPRVGRTREEMDARLAAAGSPPAERALVHALAAPAPEERPAGMRAVLDLLEGGASP